MKDQQGVYWHQGMFLQPQHFQMAELHQLFQNKPIQDACTPHFWGVGGLELVSSATTNRRVEVQSAQLLFPDRSYVEYPGNAVIQPRAFDAAWVEGDKPFTVYLGLKKLSPHEPNVTVVEDLAQAGSASTRYASLTQRPDVADLYSEGPIAQVGTLLHVVRIFFETELDKLQDYVLIPALRLVRDGDGIKLSESFIPPCYTLAGSPVLLRLIKDIRDELAGRARQLQEYKTPRETQRAEFDGEHIIFLLTLRSLNRLSPYLFHLTETQQVHPWLAYGALRQLIGELSSFSERFNMLGESEEGSPGLPPYDHANLEMCCGVAFRLINSLLAEISVGPEFLTALEYRDDWYVGKLSGNVFNPRNCFYLVIRTENDQEWVVDSVRRNVRLAAGKDMPGLIAHALPGLDLTHIPAAPQGVPRRANSTYFRIEQMSPLWEIVEREGVIALYWLGAPADMKAEIVVLRR